MLFATSKINQPNRKSHTQQKEEINKKVEDLTRVKETLLFKN